MLVNWKNVLVFWLTTLVIWSCTKTVIIPNDSLIQIPEGFPDMPFPEDNPLTAASVELGRKLFFEKAMSVDSSISCGSCHHPHLAFSDSVDFSPGAFGRAGTRNAPTLTNVGYQPYYLKEGGVATLEMQVLVPIQEHNEFDNNILHIADRLNGDSAYVRMSQEAYGRDPDPICNNQIHCEFRADLDQWGEQIRFMESGESLFNIGGGTREAIVLRRSGEMFRMSWRL